MQINFQIFYASAAFTVDPRVGVSCRGEDILENSLCFSVTVVARCVSRNTPRDFLSLSSCLPKLSDHRRSLLLGLSVSVPASLLFTPQSTESSLFLKLYELVCMLKQERSQTEVEKVVFM